MEILNNLISKKIFSILLMFLFFLALITRSYSTPKPVQIIVDPDNVRWLKYQDNGSIFICGPGDPEGFLYRGTLNDDGTRDGDQMELIEKIKGTVANCIYMQIKANRV